MVLNVVRGTAYLVILDPKNIPLRKVKEIFQLCPSYIETFNALVVHDSTTTQRYEDIDQYQHLGWVFQDDIKKINDQSQLILREDQHELLKSILHLCDNFVVDHDWYEVEYLSK